MMTFMIYAMLGVTLISIASAIIGTYIVTRRMVFISGGITHACFGGLGLGYYLGWSPLAMASLFAVGGALGVERLSRNGVRRDSAIAVIWSTGMALGILFICMTEGYVPELNTFLFGNVLTITPTDITLFALFAAVLILFYIFFFRMIVTVSFDPDFARTRNLPVNFINLIMTLFVGVAIVLTIRMIGIMLLMSLVSLPQMISEKFTRRYLPLMISSVILSLVGCMGGLWIAYAINVPASAAIVLLLIGLYIFAATVATGRRRIGCKSHIA